MPLQRDRTDGLAPRWKEDNPRKLRRNLGSSGSLGDYGARQNSAGPGLGMTRSVSVDQYVPNSAQRARQLPQLPTRDQANSGRVRGNVASSGVGNLDTYVVQDDEVTRSNVPTISCNVGIGPQGGAGVQNAARIQGSRVQNSAGIQSARVQTSAGIHSDRDQSVAGIQGNRIPSGVGVQCHRVQSGAAIQSNRVQSGAVIQGNRIQSVAGVQGHRVQSGIAIQSDRVQSGAGIRDPRIHNAPGIQSTGVQRDMVVQGARIPANDSEGPGRARTRSERGSLASVYISSHPEAERERQGRPDRTRRQRSSVGLFF